MTRIKRLALWIPYLLILAVLYALGRAAFHIHQPILFLGVVIPGLSAAYIVAMYLFFREDGHKS